MERPMDNDIVRRLTWRRHALTASSALASLIAAGLLRLPRLPPVLQRGPEIQPLAPEGLPAPPPH